jgi:head-tail adaptor
MLKAGSLDRRVTLERAYNEKDRLGTEVPTWTSLATVRASRTDLRGREQVESAELAAEQWARFTVRWSRQLLELDATCRLVDERGRDWAISSVVEVGRRKSIEIMAVARAERPACE